MKICRNCNMQYDDGQKFCNRCGAPLEDAPEYEEESPKSNKTAIILLGVGIIVLILASVLLVGMFQNRQKEQEIRQAQAQAAQAEAAAEEAAAEAAAQQAAAEAAAQQAAAEEAAARQAEAQQAAAEAEAQQAAEEAAEAAAQQAAAEAARQQSVSSLSAKWDAKLEEAEAEDHFIARSNRGGFDNEMYTEQARYDLWDALLNELWQDLKGVMSESAMNSLREEQQAWIRQKETMTADFWSGYDVDYSGYPNAPASVTTKDRVYYLRNYIPD